MLLLVYLEQIKGHISPPPGHLSGDIGASAPSPQLGWFKLSLKVVQANTVKERIKKRLETFTQYFIMGW